MCIRETIASTQLIQPVRVPNQQRTLTSRVVNPFQRVRDLQPNTLINRSGVPQRNVPNVVLNPSALPSPVRANNRERRSDAAQDSVRDRRQVEVQPRQSTRAADPVPTRQPTRDLRPAMDDVPQRQLASDQDWYRNWQRQQASQRARPIQTQSVGNSFPC